MKLKFILSLFTSLLSLVLVTAQQTLTETVEHDGLTREYIVYIPASYDETKPTPLMFNFHGYTGQAGGHMLGTRMRPVADAEGFVLVYPQGSLYFGSTHWNVGSWTTGSPADDIGFTEVMIDELAATYNIDLDRVYSCGYSNGGYFSFELACHLSDRIAAIGSVGGKMSNRTFTSCDPSHPIPVVTIHGTADPIVSYSGNTPVGSKTVPETNVFWAENNNMDTTPTVEDLPDLDVTDGSTVERFTYSNGDNCTSVHHYKVNGDGHNWPGAWGNMDIDASRVIWDFVSAYDINGLIDCPATSVTESIIDSKGVNVYPNPAKDMVTIDMGIQETVTIHISSLLGERLLSQDISPMDNTISILDLPIGVYLIKLRGETLKLIKAE